MPKLVWQNKKNSKSRKVLRNKKFKQRVYSSLKKRKSVLKKGISILPNLFTLGNAFFGFYSVVFAANSEFVAAASCILLGALMDALDGRVARLAKVTSLLGLQLDSLADAITFCFAPAFLVYFAYLKSFGLLGILAVTLYLSSGLLRLARFNLISKQQTIYFLGLPSTISGCFLASVVLYTTNQSFHYFYSLFYIFLVCLLAGLMVSRVPFFAFKQKLFRFKKNWVIVVGVIFFAFLATLRINTFLLLILSLYLIGSIFCALFYKKIFTKTGK
jgi:CDP-diacylglycerol---serine O-phosphatidyltransferase